MNISLTAGKPDVSAEIAVEEFDMPVKAMARRLIAAINQGHVTIDGRDLRIIVVELRD